MKLTLRRRSRAVAPELHRLLVLAVEESRSLGHDFVGTEHLLLACLADADLEPARALRELRVTAADVRAEIVDVVGAGTASDGSRIDPTALASIGIDFDEVRRAIEDRFGRGALERTCAGRPNVTRRAKKALEEARSASGCFAPGAEEVLLAIVRDDDSLAAEILRRQGVGARQVVEALARVRGEAA